MKNKPTNNKETTFAFRVNEQEKQQIFDFMFQNKYRFVTTFVRSAIFEKINNKPIKPNEENR